MANLNDIMTLADSLGEQRVLVVKDRCTCVKNRHSTCSRCEDICPTGAITLGPNRVELMSAQCEGCGACTTVCPTEALVPLDPTDAELRQRVAAARKATGSTLYFACARMHAKQLADPSRYAVVPCLARVEESLLMEQILDGVDRVVLIDGNCSNCKLQVCGPIVQMVASTTNDLLAARGNDVRVERVSAFPDELVDASQQEMDLGAERRAALLGSAQSVKGVMGKAIGALAQIQASKDSTSATVLEAMGLTDRDDPAKHVGDPERQVTLLDCLYELGENEDAQVVTRFFGAFAHDNVKCRKCGVCARVCPTDALKQVRYRKNGISRVSLEFSASECLQCHLCEDICFRSCITVSPLVSLADVFSFDPVRFPCSPAQAKAEAEEAAAEAAAAAGESTSAEGSAAKAEAEVAAVGSSAEVAAADPAVD
ncbi:MAG: 4Fe-4S binding protein [Coriobacteriia bacterium]|nr:4Fe-4S binding protein [Coriobacteriia bacterium]